MPYMSAALARANEQLSPSGPHDPELLDQLAGVSTVLEAMGVLDVASVVPEEYQAALAEFAQDLPPAIDAAIVAAAQNALGRGLRVTFTWQPGDSHELRVWDVATAEDDDGMVNVHLVAPEPYEAEPTA